MAAQCPPTTNGRSSSSAKTLAERDRVDPALLINGDDLGRAEAEVAKHHVDGVVTLRTDQHSDPRRTCQTVVPDVPPRPRQHRIAGSPGR